MDSPMLTEDVDDIDCIDLEDHSVASIRKHLSFSPDVPNPPVAKGHHGPSKLNTTVDALNTTAGTEASTDGREPIRVFLRLKPLSLDAGKAEHGCMDFDSTESRVTLIPPETGSRNNGPRDPQHFYFSRVFAPQTTQSEFFENTALPLVADLARGRNGLMFAYGITNSGKTFTIQGTPADAGVLPRAVDVLFNSIRGKISGADVKYRPLHFSSVESFQDATLRDRFDSALREEVLNGRDPIQALKDAVLQQRREAGVAPTPLRAAGKTAQAQQNAQNIAQNSNAQNGALPNNKDATAAFNLSSLNMTALAELAADDEFSAPRAAPDSRSVSVSEDATYAVYVSYTEIYNEYVYDLLTPAVATLPVKRRPVLKMMQDREHLFCVEGAREILVRSPEEAYTVLRYGQRNRRVAATILNQESSRSHGVLTIRLMTIPKGPTPPSVSVLTFVDLAGSERASRTQNKGAQLKEASHINTSLMTLARCIETLRSNQLHPGRQEVVPFRDSKLTLLLHNFLRGTGKAVMVVNAGQSASDFVETAKVMRLSAVAKQVKTTAEIGARVQTHRRRNNAEAAAVNAAVAAQNGATAVQITALSAQCAKYEEYIDDLEKENDDLELKLENLLRDHAENIARVEAEVRDEVAREMAEQLVQMENSYKTAIAESNDACDERTERRADIHSRALQSAKKRAGTRSRVAFAGSASALDREAERKAVSQSVAAGTSPLAQSSIAMETDMISVASVGVATELTGAVISEVVAKATHLMDEVSRAEKESKLERELAEIRTKFEEIAPLVQCLQAGITARDHEIARLKSEVKMGTVTAASLRRTNSIRAPASNVFAAAFATNSTAPRIPVETQTDTTPVADSEAQTDATPMETAAAHIDSVDSNGLVTAATAALEHLDDMLDIAIAVGDVSTTSTVDADGSVAIVGKRKSTRGRKTRSPKRCRSDIAEEGAVTEEPARLGAEGTKRRKLSGEGNTSVVKRNNVSFAEDSMLESSVIDRNPDRNQSYLEAVAPTMPLAEQVEAVMQMETQEAAPPALKQATKRKSSVKGTGRVSAAAAQHVTGPSSVVAPETVVTATTTAARRKSMRANYAANTDPFAGEVEDKENAGRAVPVAVPVPTPQTATTEAAVPAVEKKDKGTYGARITESSYRVSANSVRGRVRADGAVAKGPRLGVLVKNSPIAKRLVQSGVATQSHMRTLTPEKRADSRVLGNVLGEITARTEGAANTVVVEDAIGGAQAKAPTKPNAVVAPKAEQPMARTIVDRLFEKPHPVVTRILFFVGLATEVLQQDLIEFISYAVNSDATRSTANITARKLIDLMMTESSTTAGKEAAGKKGAAPTDGFGVLLEKTRKRQNHYSIHPALQQYVTDRCNIASGDAIENIRNEVADYILLKGR